MATGHGTDTTVSGGDTNADRKDITLKDCPLLTFCGYLMDGSLIYELEEPEMYVHIHSFNPATLENGLFITFDVDPRNGTPDYYGMMPAENPTLLLKDWVEALEDVPAIIETPDTPAESEIMDAAPDDQYAALYVPTFTASQLRAMCMEDGWYARL